MVKIFAFADPFYPGILRCLVYSVFEGGRKIYKNVLAMGVTLGGDNIKSGKNINFVPNKNAHETIVENWSDRQEHICKTGGQITSCRLPITYKAQFFLISGFLFSNKPP